MDAAVVEALHRLTREVGLLRRELADHDIEADDRLARIEAALAASPRAAPNEAGERLLAAVATEFGERAFAAVELMGWCAKCVDQAQRDAYRALQSLCEDDNPTSLQAGIALRALAGRPGPLRIERRGEKRGSALWAIVRE